MLGDGKRLCKIIQQHCSAGISVRLEYRPNLMVAHAHGSGKHGGKLCRVVRKVVGNGHAFKFA